METNVEEMMCGKEAVIIGICAGFGLQRRLCSLNLREGKIIKKITQHPFRGPIIIEIDGRQCAIGRGMAKKILVKEK